MIGLIDIKIGIGNQINEQCMDLTLSKRQLQGKALHPTRSIIWLRLKILKFFHFYLMVFDIIDPFFTKIIFLPAYNTSNACSGMH